MGALFSSRSGGTQTTTTKNKQTVPGYVTELGKSAAGLAHTEGRREYSPYGGERVAALHPGYQQAYDRANKQANRQTPGLDMAGDVYQGAMKYGMGNDYLDSIWGGKGFQTQEWGEAARDKYMSPYAKGALDPVAEEMRRQAGIHEQGLQNQYKTSGAFGGEREAIMSSENRRNTQRSVGDMYAQGMDRAYQNAQGAFGRDQDRSLNAESMRTGAAMDLHRTGLGAAEGMQGLSALRSDLSSRDIDNYLKTSRPFQQHDQSVADAGYENWLREQDWAGRAMDLYNRAGSMPHDTSSASTTTQPGLRRPSPFSQAIGAVGVGLGAYYTGGGRFGGAMGGGAGGDGGGGGYVNSNMTGNSRFRGAFGGGYGGGGSGFSQPNPYRLSANWR